MDSALGTYIQTRLTALGLTVRAFGRKLGVTSSYLSKVIKGDRPVPYDRIDKWAAALDLEGDDAAEFKELAWLALSPVEVQELVAELRSRAAKQVGKRGRS